MPITYIYISMCSHVCSSPGLAAQHFASYRGDGGTKLFFFFFFTFYSFFYLLCRFLSLYLYTTHPLPKSLVIMWHMNSFKAGRSAFAICNFCRGGYVRYNLPTDGGGGEVILDGACLMESNFLCKLCFSLFSLSLSLSSSLIYMFQNLG